MGLRAESSFRLRGRANAACLLIGLAVMGAALVALPARATYGARTTADEPQYLLSALSLAEDRDLWIDDELAAERYRDFHEVGLPVQTEPLDNGREISPHDPLLPVVLALPMGLGGWALAKATLAVGAGALAGLLCWVAHRRFGVSLGVAAGVVLAFGLTAPLTAYATQIYPELPAALLVTVAIAVLMKPGPDRLASRDVVVLALAVTALPWLGIKYGLVAAALALAGAGRLARPLLTRRGPWDRMSRNTLVALLAGLGVAAMTYLVVHRLIYGGWTVYAAGDHFVDGELTVVGNDPNYLGRSRRLLGLLLDRSFGLAAWMPGYLLMVPALAVLVWRRPRGWFVLVGPLAAGWATATWVALTMHGWWWPGRQVVVVLPCVVLAVAWWLDRARRVLPVLAVSAVMGLASWLWLVTETLRGQRTLIVDFYETANPLYRAWRWVLPDYWHLSGNDWVLQACWLVVLAGSACAAVLHMRGGAVQVLGEVDEISGGDAGSQQTRRPTHASA